jgi:Protein of unknown function (DUF1236)
MTRVLMSGVAVAALLAFGSLANAQTEQPTTQTMPNQGGGSGPDTGAGGAAGSDVQGQGGADVQTQGGAGAQTQMPQDSQSGKSQQKSSDGMDTKKKSSDTMQKQSEDTKGGDKTKKQSQKGEESSGATGATGKAGKIDIPQGKRSQVAKSFSSHKVKSVDIDVDVSVGVAVPRTVLLHPVPVDIVEIVPAFRHYRYFVLANGEIVIVDPATFMVVYVIAA